MPRSSGGRVVAEGQPGLIQQPVGALYDTRSRERFPGQKSASQDARPNSPGSNRGPAWVTFRGPRKNAPSCRSSPMSDQKFIYHMRDLRKIVPPKREILKGIYLSFFPG